MGFGRVARLAWRGHRRFIIFSTVLVVAARVAAAIFGEDGRVAAYLFLLAAPPVLFAPWLGAVPQARAARRGPGPGETSPREFFAAGLFALLAVQLVAGLAAASIDFPSGREAVVFSYFVFAALLFHAGAALAARACRRILPALVLAPVFTVLAAAVQVPLLAVLYLLLPFFDLLVLGAFLCLYAALLAALRLACQGRTRRALLGVPIACLAVSLAAHLAAGVYARLDLARALAFARRAGLAVELAEIVPAPVPEEENAAVLYREAFEIAGRLVEAHRGANLSGDPDQWPQEVRQSFFADRETARLFELIERAAARPACNFDLGYGWGVSMDLGHLSGMRVLGRLSAARVRFLAHAGEYAAATVSARLGFRLGDALAGEPVLISQLVRVALNSLAADAAATLLSAPGDSLPAADRRLLAAETSGRELDLGPALGFELSGYFTHNYYSSPIRVLVPGDPADPGFTRSFKQHLFGWLSAPVFRLEKAFSARRLGQLLPLAGRPWHEAREEVGQWGERYAWEPAPGKLFPRTPHNFVPRMIHGSLGRVMEHRARNRAALDTLGAALALDIFRLENGFLPGSLAELVPEYLPAEPLDPFTGRALVYRPGGEGFTVYSVGPSGIDHGGVSDRDTGADDIGWRLGN